MSVTVATSPQAASNENGEQCFVMGRVSWDSYVKISDALEDQAGLRLIYCEGRLAFVGKSRRHEWLSECLGHLVMAIAAHLGNPVRAGGRSDLSPSREGSGPRGRSDVSLRWERPQDAWRKRLRLRH